jgi:hypothetical protein
MSDPYLFDELADELPVTPAPVYTTPIEQATFDIMELVDGFFRSSVTVEEYDGIQRNVKKILTEAFDEKKSSPSVRAPLLIVRDEYSERG